MSDGKVLKGLRVSIYKNPLFKGCANGGLSEYADEATLVPSPDFPDVPEIFEVSEDSPAVAMVKRDIGGEYLTAYPVDEDGNICKSGRMMGGTYISTSDSRFPARYPVPLHDRTEW